MAEKKLTLAEILAKRKEFEEMVAAQIESERPAALKAVQEQIKLFSFTASELGLQATPTRTSPAAKTVGTRTMTKPLKSKDDIGLTGVWLAHPP